MAPLRTPLIIGSLIGVLLALTGTELPPTLRVPLSLLGAMAVPAVLLAYGMAPARTPAMRK